MTATDGVIATVLAVGAPSPETPTHQPCCTAHGVPMTCARYRRTHFVEVRPCCSLDAQAIAGEAPSPPPPCPGCGGPMGDGDRVSHGRCGGCVRPRRRPCWCGRPALPGELDCAEHDVPVTATAPSDPLTPGGVFDRRYP